MTWRVGVLVLLAACQYGGGPTLGIGLAHHDVFWGVEGTTGYPIVEFAAGYQSYGHTTYFRGAAALDLIGIDAHPDAPRVLPGGRIGGGFVFSELPDTGMFQMGANVTWEPAAPAGCHGWNDVFVFSVDLRYLSEWSIVLSPRIERHQAFCFY